MEISKQVYAFQLDGKPVSCQPYGNGHINATLKVCTDTGNAYIAQRINRSVFPDPAQVMDNVIAVTGYLAQFSSRPDSTLHFLPTVNGQYYHIDEDGQYWRMCRFVDGICLDRPETDRDFYQCAMAFGRFQELLTGFPAHTLHETIANFHNTPHRFKLLQQAVAADPLGRAAKVEDLIKTALSFAPIAGNLQQMLESGKLPLRVTHNDTKLNNVLLDKTSRAPLCVLDLDTVMPGLSAWDFGDSIRSGAATAPEDAQDPSQMKLDLHLYRVYTEGYLTAAPSLTDAEVRVLPLGALTMTVEVGIRFLTDYLNGDVYFKTDYPTHNLIRARAQLALAADMLEKLEEMEQITYQLAASAGR